MTRLPWLRWLDASVTIRLGFLVLAGTVALLLGDFVEVLPWLVLVGVLDAFVVVLDRMPAARRGTVESLITAMLALSAAAAGAAFALEGVAAALLILIPAYHAGTRYGRFGFLLTSVVGSLAYLVTVAATPDLAVTPTMLAWLAAASLLGLLGALNQRLAAEQAEAEADPAAQEAIELIERLHDLSSQMSTGLDALASATLALDLLAVEVPSTRSAVLVTHDATHLVPVALRGSTRAPWAVADRVTQVLALGPSRWSPTVVTFTDDLGSRRALVVPFALGTGSSTTVLVADRPDGQPFTRQEQRVAGEVTRRIAPTIQAGLLFGELRQVASIEERDRIARDIHDGIAQELAALGYRVDALRAQAGPQGTSMRDSLDGLREQLGGVMADLRLNITDLRVAERPGGGLGSVLGAAVQSFGSVTGMRTTVTVSERQRRLDPRVEILVHRLVMDVLADAQASSARNAWVTLTASVVGPTSVEVSHDGNPRIARQTYRTPQIQGVDASLTARMDTPGRTTVSLSVEESSQGTARGSSRGGE